MFAFRKAAGPGRASSSSLSPIKFFQPILHINFIYFIFLKFGLQDCCRNFSTLSAEMEELFKRTIEIVVDEELQIQAIRIEIDYSDLMEMVDNSAD